MHAAENVVILVAYACGCSGQDSLAVNRYVRYLKIERGRVEQVGGIYVTATT